MEVVGDTAKFLSLFVDISIVTYIVATERLPKVKGRVILRPPGTGKEVVLELRSKIVWSLIFS